MKIFSSSKSQWNTGQRSANSSTLVPKLVTEDEECENDDLVEASAAVSFRARELRQLFGFSFYCYRMFISTHISSLQCCWVNSWLLFSSPEGSISSNKLKCLASCRICEGFYCFRNRWILTSPNPVSFTADVIKYRHVRRNQLNDQTQSSADFIVTVNCHCLIWINSKRLRAKLLASSFWDECFRWRDKKSREKNSAEFHLTRGERTEDYEPIEINYANEKWKLGSSFPIRSIRWWMMNDTLNKSNNFSSIPSCKASRELYRSHIRVAINKREKKFRSN